MVKTLILIFLMVFLSFSSLVIAREENCNYYLKKNPNYSDNIEVITNLTVKKVYDGDTVLVENKNDYSEFKIRLLGIQTTEIFKDEKPQPYSIEAKSFLENEILNKKIFVIIDKKYKKDKYDRYLGIICLENLDSDGVSFNEKLIQESLAYVYILSPNSLWIETLIKGEDAVISLQKNIWQHDRYKLIKINDAKNFIGEYKILDANVLSFTENSKSIFFYLENTKSKGVAIKIDKKLLNNNNINKAEFIKKYLNQNIRIRGFINQYNPKFGPLINVINLHQLEVLEVVNL